VATFCAALWLTFTLPLTPLLEKHLNVRQKGKTSSDSEEVGLALVGGGGPIFYHRHENAQTSSESEEV
jgi:hypothetical protein